MLAFGHRLRRLTALTRAYHPAFVATVEPTASFVPVFTHAPDSRGFRPPPTAFPTLAQCVEEHLRERSMAPLFVLAGEFVGGG